MPQRTDTFDLARLRLTSGEGKRLDLFVHVDPFDYGGSRYAVEPELVPARLDVSRTTGNGWALRLRFAAELDGPCMRCLENAGPTFDVDAYEVHQPGGGEELTSPYIDGRARRRGVGARRAGARAAGPAHVPPGLRRAVRGMRREPQRGPLARARARAEPALGEALRAEVRVGPLPSLAAMAVPKQKQSHARTAQRRAQHKITAPAVNDCPQCRRPRRPHRVCPHCGFYAGREVVHVHDHDHDHDH